MATPISVPESSLTSLAGKTVLVTGASSGIGLATAELFYGLGCNVSFIGGRKQPTTKIPLVDNPRALVGNADISSWPALLAVFKATVAKFKKIDIVVANAGCSEPLNQTWNLQTTENGDPEPLDLRVVDVDFKGTAYTCALGIHYMKETGGGSIVIISSMAGYHAVPDLPNYCASKHAATGLLRSLPPRGKPLNIAISLVAPHITWTPGCFVHQWKPGKEAFQAARSQMRPMGLRLSSAETCALAVGYLAVGGIERTGMGVMVEDDEINNLESELHDARPAWFLAKEDNKKAAEAYANLRPEEAT